MSSLNVMIWGVITTQGMPSCRQTTCWRNDKAIFHLYKPKLNRTSSFGPLYFFAVFQIFSLTGKKWKLYRDCFTMSWAMLCLSRSRKRKLKPVSVVLGGKADAESIIIRRGFIHAPQKWKPLTIEPTTLPPYSWKHSKISWQKVS
jgi:hypothetical protein